MIRRLPCTGRLVFGRAADLARAAPILVRPRQERRGAILDHQEEVEYRLLEHEQKKERCAARPIAPLARMPGEARANSLRGAVGSCCGQAACVPFFQRLWPREHWPLFRLSRGRPVGPHSGVRRWRAPSETGTLTRGIGMQHRCACMGFCKLSCQAAPNTEVR